MSDSTEPTWCSVLLEADAPEVTEEQAEDLMDALAAVGADSPVVSFGHDAVSARFSLADVEPFRLSRTLERAEEIFEGAINKAGVPVTNVYRVEAVTDEVLARELEEPAETYVGVSEIAEILGVSRQRVQQLRGRPDFPTPVAELAAGPVWRRSNLQRFVDEWDRRPGHPTRSWNDLRRDDIANEALEALTDRERALLLLIVEGMTSPEVAEIMHVTAAAVRSTLGRIYKKLGVSSRREAAIGEPKISADTRSLRERLEQVAARRRETKGASSRG